MDCYKWHLCSKLLTWLLFFTSINLESCVKNGKLYLQWVGHKATLHYDRVITSAMAKLHLCEVRSNFPAISHLMPDYLKPNIWFQTFDAKIHQNKHLCKGRSNFPTIPRLMSKMASMNYVSLFEEGMGDEMLLNTYVGEGGVS